MKPKHNTENTNTNCHLQPQRVIYIQISDIYSTENASEPRRQNLVWPRMPTEKANQDLQKNHKTRFKFPKPTKSYSVKWLHRVEMKRGEYTLKLQFAKLIVPEPPRHGDKQHTVTDRHPEPYLNVRSPRGQSPNTHDMQYRLSIRC